MGEVGLHLSRGINWQSYRWQHPADVCFFIALRHDKKIERKHQREIVFSQPVKVRCCLLHLQLPERCLFLLLRC